MRYVVGGLEERDAHRSGRSMGPRLHVASLRECTGTIMLQQRHTLHGTLLANKRNISY